MKRFIGYLLFLFETGLCYAANGPGTPVDNAYPYFITTAVYPQDKDLFEVILQPEYNYGLEHEDEHDLLLMPQMYYGVTDQWQVYLTFIPYLIHYEPGFRSSGPADTNFGTQYSWMYINKSTFSASVLFNFRIPTGDINKNLTDGFIHYEPFIIAAKDFIHSNWRTQFFAQTGFSIVQRLKRHADPTLDDPAAHYYIFNGGIAERSEKINFSLEFNWFTNTWNNNGDDNQMYVTPGVYAKLTKNIAIGLGVPIGLTRDAYEYIIMGNLLIDIDINPSKEKTNNQDQHDKTNLHGDTTNLFSPPTPESDTLKTSGSKDFDTMSSKFMIPPRKTYRTPRA